MAEIELGILIKLIKEGNGAQLAEAELSRLLSETQRIDAEFDDLSNAIDRANVAFEKQRDNSISLRTEFKRLGQEGKTSREDLNQLAAQITEAQDAELHAIQATKQLIDEYNNLATATDRAADDYDKLLDSLDRSEGMITGVSVENKKLTGSLDGIADGAQAAARGVERVGDEAVEANTKLDAIKTNLQSFGQKALQGFATSIQFFLINKLEDAARATIDFVQESDAAFRTYDENLRGVLTLAGDFSQEKYASMNADVRTLANQMQRTTDEVLPAYYKALSLQSVDPLNDLELASRAARAGQGELTGTLEAGLSVLNAYGEGVIDLAAIYDLFFKAIEDGNITMSDLESGISKVTSAAGEINVGLEDVLAMLVVMTQQGDSFNEAIELSSTLLTQLSLSGTQQAKAFEEAAGQSFRSFIDEGGNVAEALQKIQDYVNDNNLDFGDFFAGETNFYRDQQALRGALELTGIHMQEFVDQTRIMETEAAGSMENAAAIMEESSQRAADSLAVAKENFSLAVGELLEEPITNLYTNFAADFNKLSGAFEDFILPEILTDLATVETLNQLDDVLNRLAANDFFKEGLFGFNQKQREVAATIHDIILAAVDDYEVYAAIIQSLPRDMRLAIDSTLYDQAADNAEIALSRLQGTAILTEETFRSLREPINEAAAEAAAFAAALEAGAEARRKIHGFKDELADQVRPTIFFDDSDFDLPTLKDSEVLAATVLPIVDEDALAQAQADLQQAFVVEPIEAFQTVEGLTSTLYAAQIAEDAAAIDAAMADIHNSLSETFVDVGLETALQQDDLAGFDALIDAAIGMGIYTEAQATLQKELAATTLGFEAMAEAVANLELDPADAIDIGNLIKDGSAQSFDDAVEQVIAAKQRLADELAKPFEFDTTGLDEAEARLAAKLAGDGSEARRAAEAATAGYATSIEQLEALISASATLDGSDPDVEIVTNAEQTLTELGAVDAFQIQDKYFTIHVEYDDPGQPGGGEAPGGHRDGPDAPAPGQNYLGTDFWRGGLTWVGERGR
ncbi:MAG: phage tail tape measure protein [Anaerolineae bacterium]|nr:phage tail tape measure protein [Anaerolineae bacterium]